MTRSICIILLTVLSLSCAQRQPSVPRSGIGFTAPEEAAITMFRAGAYRDRKLFVRSRLLGVCEGVNDWPTRYTDCLQQTMYWSGKKAVSVDDLPKQMKEGTARVVASDEFSSEDMDKLHGQFVSTYYAPELRGYEVAALNGDGLEYKTRIVVSKNDDRWYAIPRCRSSQEFYRVLDAMPLTAVVQ